MPLPPLQTIGDESVTFLYAINWTQSVRQPDVGRYQRGEGGPFDNRIFLRPGVGEALVRLNHSSARWSTTSGRSRSRR